MAAEGPHLPRPARGRPPEEPEARAGRPAGRAAPRAAPPARTPPRRPSRSHMPLLLAMLFVLAAAALSFWWIERQGAGEAAAPSRARRRRPPPRRARRRAHAPPVPPTTLAAPSAAPVEPTVPPEPAPTVRRQRQNRSPHPSPRRLRHPCQLRHRLLRPRRHPAHAHSPPAPKPPEPAPPAVAPPRRPSRAPGAGRAGGALAALGPPPGPGPAGPARHRPPPGPPRAGPAVARGAARHHRGTAEVGQRQPDDRPPRAGGHGHARRLRHRARRPGRRPHEAPLVHRRRVAPAVFHSSSTADPHARAVRPRSFHSSRTADPQPVHRLSTAPAHPPHSLATGSQQPLWKSRPERRINRMPDASPLPLPGTASAACSPSRHEASPIPRGCRGSCRRSWRSPGRHRRVHGAGRARVEGAGASCSPAPSSRGSAPPCWPASGGLGSPQPLPRRPVALRDPRPLALRRLPRPLGDRYTVVALGAALLFGTRGAAAATAVIGASGVFIALAEVRGWLPSPESTRPTTALLIFLASLLSLVGIALYATAELRHAIEGLRESEARVRSIVESSPMAILLYELEPSGRLVLTGSNPAGDRVLGIPVSPARGADHRGGLPRPRRDRGAGPLPADLRRRRLVGGGGRVPGRPVPGRLRGPRLPDGPGDVGGDVPRHLGAPAGRGGAPPAGGPAPPGPEDGGGRPARRRRRPRLQQPAHRHHRLRRAAPARARRTTRACGRSQHDHAARRSGPRASTRQLLAFSRKQVLEPQVSTSTPLVAETARMLRRAHRRGRRARRRRLDPALGRSRADPARSSRSS